MLPPPRPRQQVQYQKPRRLNTVSVTLLAVTGVLVWVGISFWPLWVLRSNVKNELEEAMPRLWKLNLRPDAQARSEAAVLRREIVQKLHQLGVKDQKLDLAVDRNKERVALTATYSASGELRGLERKFIFAFAPRVETDAARVDW